MAKINIVSDIGEFFLKEIESSSLNNSLNFSPLLKKYLADLLVRFSNNNNYQKQLQGENRNRQSLAEIWLQSNQLSLKEQLQKLQGLGDYTLFTSGFFADKIHGSIVDMDYYHAIGTQSYEKVGEINCTLNNEKKLNVFFELAAQFKKITDLLEEISVRSNLFDDKDILKLYQKWQNTRSEKWEKILFTKGFITNKDIGDKN